MKKNTFNARVSFLETKCGGRSGPIHSGYRSLLRFENHQSDFGFELQFLGEKVSQEVLPGSSVLASFFVWSDSGLPKLSIAQKFEIREGTKVVGDGEIIELP